MDHRVSVGSAFLGTRLSRSNRLVSLCGLLLTLLFLPTPFNRLEAQTTGALSGTVSNPSNVPVFGALVQLRSVGGAAFRKAETDALGRYAFESLPAGSYTLVVTKEGFGRTTLPVTVGSAGAVTKNVTLSAVNISDVVVTASRSVESINNVPAAVSVVDATDIQKGRSEVSIEESLKRVPGVRVEDELGTAGRTRIIIRGNGTRANSPAGSGVRGVRVLVDGIPKNNAGGSAQDLINIDLGSVARMEVLRGPSSALYGNQAGGVVNLITEEGGPDQRFDYQQTLGSFGLRREHAKVLGQTGLLGYRISAHRTDQTGFRRSSDFHNTGIDSKLVLNIDDQSRMTVIAAYEQNFQRSPGPLTAAQMAVDRKSASPTFVTSDVRSTVDEMRFGLIYNRDVTPADQVQLTTYYIPRHLGPFIQIGVRIPQDFTNRGINLRYLRSAPLGDFQNRFTTGVDFQDTPITTGVFSSTTGVAASELEENATTGGLYVLDELSILPTVRLSAGLRYDNIHFRSRDLTKPGTKASRTFTATTPKIGITYQPLDAISFYGTYSKGFETPIIGELRVVPGGAFGFNNNLDPQRSTNYEVGSRGQVGGRVSYELALFHQIIDDMINPLGTFPNNSFSNIGRVKENGVEAGAQVSLIGPLSLGAAYTFSDFKLADFVVNNVTLSDNELPGVPRHTFFGDVRYNAANGIFAALEGQYVSKFFFNNVNDASNPPYAVVNFRLNYDARLDHARISPFFGINNIFNRKYSAFGLINDATRRFFNPLPGTSGYGGVKLEF